MSLLSVSGAIDAGIGFVVAAFMPRIGRIIKSWFVSETTAAKADVASAASDVIKKA
jgi:hypothetical protein